MTKEDNVIFNLRIGQPYLRIVQLYLRIGQPFSENRTTLFENRTSWIGQPYLRIRYTNDKLCIAIWQPFSGMTTTTKFYHVENHLEPRPLLRPVHKWLFRMINKVMRSFSLEKINRKTNFLLKKLSHRISGQKIALYITYAWVECYQGFFKHFTSHGS